MQRERSTFSFVMRCATVLVAMALGVLAGRAQGEPSSAKAAPATAEALQAGLALQLEGRYEEALRAYEPLTAADVRDDLVARALYSAARCRSALGEHGRAVELLLALVERDAKHPLADDALLAAARLCRDELEQADKAIALCQRLREEYPKSPLQRAALLVIARTLECQLELDEAVKTYHQVVIETERQPAPAEDLGGVAVVAARRAESLIANGGGQSPALAAYLNAERMALRPDYRNEALLGLIRMIGLYRDSPLVDDALVQMIRIHLVKGDEDAARRRLEQLLRVGPGSLAVEPVRGCASAIAGWLLADVDRQVAGEAEIFPELFGYRAGTNLSVLSGPEGKRRVLTFRTADQRGGDYWVGFRIVVGRPVAGVPAAYPNLDLDVAVEIDTTSDVVRNELERALKEMSVMLASLDRAVSGAATTAGKSTTVSAPLATGEVGSAD